MATVNNAPTWIEIITIICIIICFLTTTYQLIVHLRHYTHPVYQRKILVILQMPPVYILFSTLTIWFNDDNGYFLLVRDIYESFVIYAFFKLLGAYVGYEPDKSGKEEIEHKICEILAEKGPHPHQCPFNYCLKPMNLVNMQEARKYYRICKIGILQYIPIKIILAGLMFLVIYDEGGTTSDLYDLCGIVEFVDVCIALYWLVFFFHIFYEDLKPFRPLRKFLIIKGILFLTFWQEEILNFCGVYMSTSRYIPAQNRADANVILSCLLVDIEMVIMSILTTFAFSYKDFYVGKEKKTMKLKDIINAKLIAMKMGKNIKGKRPTAIDQKGKSPNDQTPIKEKKEDEGIEIKVDSKHFQEILEKDKKNLENKESEIKNDDLNRKPKNLENNKTMGDNIEEFVSTTNRHIPDIQTSDTCKFIEKQ